MKFFGIPLPRKWWVPFMGILGMLVAGVVTVAVVWKGGVVTDAEKSRLPVERGSPTLAELDLALSLNPDYREAYEKRAVLRFRQGDFTGASADVDVALGMSPANPTLLHLRAEIRRNLADRAETRPSQ
jgi:hypothetical protein